MVHLRRGTGNASPHNLWPSSARSIKRFDLCPRSRISADSDRHRHPQVPPLRHRRDHQPDARLRRPDGHSCAGLRCRGRRPRWVAAGGDRPDQQQRRSRGLDPWSGGAVRSRPFPNPELHRPALLPAEIRRRTDIGVVLGAPSRGSRAPHADRPPAHRGQRHGAARPCLVVAPGGPGVSQDGTKARLEVDS